MLKGNNIILRTARETDLTRVAHLLAQIGDRGDYYSINLESEQQLRRSYAEHGWWSEAGGRLLITTRDDAVIGTISCFKGARYHESFEIGFLIFRREDMGKGYMGEALAIFSAYLFETRNTPRLQVSVIKGNAGAKRVAEKCGYQFEGLTRGAVFHRGEYVDLENFSLLRSERTPLKRLLTTSNAQAAEPISGQAREPSTAAGHRVAKMAG
jgi:[ribosomal protein S5]-alanine N-acetyltransferase